MADINDEFLRETLKFQGTVTEAITNIKNDITDQRTEQRNRAEKIYGKIDRLLEKDNSLNGRVGIIEDRQKSANRRAGYIAGSISGFVLFFKWLYSHFGSGGQ